MLPGGDGFTFYCKLVFSVRTSRESEWSYLMVQKNEFYARVAWSQKFLEVSLPKSSEP